MLHSKEYDHTIMYIYVAEIKLPQLVECIIYFKTACVNQQMVVCRLV